MNRNILPSEKLLSIKVMAKGKKPSPATMHAIQEGSFICTGCYRCTLVCPVGIDLQDLWAASKEDLLSRGYPEPHVWARNKNRGEWDGDIMDRAKTLIPGHVSAQDLTALSGQADTFSACFECQTCTNVCPVVANYEDPGSALDLMPHQIMHALGLGFREESLSSRMVWDCLTCYLCQEHCPQGVRVTDILYELKNLAYDRAGRKLRAGNGGECRP
jgi:heterodisulfide reductase subunit C